MKISENFDVREFVSENVWNRFRGASRWFVDPRLVLIAEKVKELASDDERAYVYINNYLYGGGYNQSGFREPGSKVGAEFSQHRFGRAIDIKIKHKGLWLTSSAMYYLVKENYHTLKKLGLTTVEDPEHTQGKHRDWLHLDVRETGRDDLFVVSP